MSPLVRSAAAAALAVAALTATAEAKPTPHLLVVRSVAVGTTTAPVVVNVRTPLSVHLTVRVNGRVRPGVFGPGVTATRIGVLTRRAGLHSGRNVIRIDARRANGDTDREVRTVTLAPAVVAPDAGPDRTIAVDGAARLGAVGMPAGVRKPTAYRWRVVRRPRGAHPQLRGAATARPVLRTGRAGTYVLRLTTTTGGRTAHDTVSVYARPDDAPDGVAIETLSSGPGGAIRVAGQGLPNTADGNGIHIAVIERRTRDVLLSGTAPRDAGGLKTLLDNVRALDGDTTDVLVVLSASQGIPQSDVPAFAALLHRIGGRLDATQSAAIRAGSPFSVIGVANTPDGSAWVNVPAKAPSDGQTVAAADLTGRLRLGAASDRYDYVSTTYPRIDTSVPGVPAGVNQIVIGSTLHNTKLTSAAALHVLVLDANSLRPLEEANFPTDGANVRTLHAAIARKLKEYADLPGRPLVIVQTMGTPRGYTPEWGQASVQIERLGGNPRIFNALDGTQRYALVGRLGEQQAIAESSTVTGGVGRIAGHLARGRDGGFLPLPGDTTDPSRDDLIDIVNQPAQPFPAFTGGQVAAEAYIGAKLGFCPAGSARCDLRQRYWKSYRSDWDSKFTTLSTRIKYPAGASFSAEEFAHVKETLLDEIGALNDVKTYFDGLLAPFGRAGTRGLVDIKALSNELYDAIQPPPATNATSYYLSLVAKIIAVPAAAAAGYAPAAALFGGLSAGLGVAAFFTQEHGAPAGGEVTARADRLSTELLDRLDAAQQDIAGMALLVVSDQGRMQAVEAHVDRDWVLDPTDTRVLAGLRLSLKQWIAEALVPVAYPTLIRATPFGAGGPSNVRLLDCGGRNPFNQPDSGQLRAIEGFNDAGTPLQPWYFFTHYFTSPKDHLTEYLFNAPNAPTPGLGIPKLEFLTPRVFGRFWLANHGAKNCDLPW